jgi:hypothetical protein
MQANLWPLNALVVLGMLVPIATMLGQGDAKSSLTLQDQRKRLSSLEAGASSERVLNVMGKPDEVRRVSGENLLDGTRLLGDFPNVGPETERWTYGNQSKGSFARVGYVSMDRNGKLVAAVSSDWFSNPFWKLPERIPPRSDEAVASPSKMSCHLDQIRLIPADEQSGQSIETNVAIKNSGVARFELKHDAATCVAKLLHIEVADSAGILLFRTDGLSRHSPYSIDPADWPVLSVAPEKELTEKLCFSPATGFGPLPPGKYSVRVHFPFDKGKYYPSNSVGFEVLESKGNKSSGK